MSNFTQAKCVNLNILIPSFLSHTAAVSKPAKILIVDDSAAMRRAIKLVLKGLAVQTHECSDGSEAVVEYAVHLPDWVLMDIRMKETDGLTAIRQIRTVFPDARIIVVTISKGDDMREAARSAGACAFVVKDNLLELRQILIDRGLTYRSEPVAS
jgi:CheY-like chemotaxis protein